MSTQKATQRELVLEYIDEFGSITPLEGMRDLGIYRLASRISEMKKMGYPVVSQWETVNTRRGTTTRIKRYSLQDGEA